MRRAIAVLAALAVAAAVAASAAQAPASARKRVKVGDDYFVHRGSIATVTVHRGTKVVWRFRGSDLHNVVAKKGPVHFRSGYRMSGHYAKRMRRAGRYTIVCTVHSGMKMKLRVVR